LALAFRLLTLALALALKLPALLTSLPGTLPPVCGVIHYSPLIYSWEQHVVFWGDFVCSVSRDGGVRNGSRILWVG